MTKGNNLHLLGGNYDKNICSSTTKRTSFFYKNKKYTETTKMMS